MELAKIVYEISTDYFDYFDYFDCVDFVLLIQFCGTLFKNGQKCTTFVPHFCLNAVYVPFRKR